MIEKQLLCFLLYTYTYMETNKQSIKNVKMLKSSEK